jgi:hypothetical protein
MENSYANHTTNIDALDLVAIAAKDGFAGAWSSHIRECSSAIKWLLPNRWE